MAYFNHAFQKVFVGTENFNTSKTGKLGSPGNILSGGEIGFVDPKSWDLVAEAPTNCCPLVLAAGSIYQNDKIGPFHGGYQESNKSKVINPKYVSQFYRVLPCQPQNEVVHIGNTEFIGQLGCCKKYFCGETYTLRVDIKGSPALRLLDHNSYIIASAYGGCCPEGSIAPVEIDPTIIFIQWAEAIVRYPVISPFLSVAVIDQEGTPWYAPGTDAAFLALFEANTWDNYVSPGYDEENCLAGIQLVGAYVDTKFQNCTFQLTDFYEVEPVRIYASEVDLNGDPCLFNGTCVNKICEGRQAMGLGESVARDVILSEQYRQNFFHSDLRIREITQGASVFNYIDRNSLYVRYYILHNVPRFNNPTSTFDNDQYLLEIITSESVGTDLLEFVEAWLGNCNSGCDLELQTVGCGQTCDSEDYYPYPGGPIGPLV
jgi:hypothetical protein